MKVIKASHGEPVITDADIPVCTEHAVLVKTEFSAMSPGTEKLLLNHSREQGKTTVLGYSAVGIAIEVGSKVKGIAEGDRVACYGAPYVQHAEYMLVPEPLAAVVPAHVDAKEAAFVGLGAIAIHAIRQADLQFGESAVLVGLGILGQIIGQIAHTAAIQVFAADLLQERCEKLKAHGLPHVFGTLEELEQELDCLPIKADSALLCANGKNNLVDRSLDWIRDRGKIVIVGDLEMSFSRGKMFAKEAQILISRAGGPGRYDKQYEHDGSGYPYGYVRWTEGRNMSEYIRLLAEQRITVSPLITHEFSFAEAPNAYTAVLQNPQETLGVIFKHES